MEDAVSVPLLHDLDELVCRLALDQSPSPCGSLICPTGSATRTAMPAGMAIAFLEMSRAAASRAARPRRQRAAGADRRYQEENGDEGAENGADLVQRVEPSGDRARLADLTDGEADGPWRHRS